MRARGEALNFSNSEPAADGALKVSKNWLHSARWDALTVLSGLTLCGLLLMFRPFGLDVRVALILFTFDRALGMVHSWSTTFLVVGSKMFAEVRRSDPDRYVRVPVALFLGSIALGVAIAKTVNISDTGSVDAQSLLYYVPYIGLFWVGHFWHFGRQDFGVLSLYRTRALQQRPIDRKVDEIYAQLMMYIIQPLIYFNAFTRSPFTTLFAWLTGWQVYTHTLATAAVCAALGMTAVILFFEWRKPTRSLGKSLYYLVMLFHPALLYFSGPSFFVYWHISYLWSHWIIASYLSAKINVGFEMQRRKSFARSVAEHLLIVGGMSAMIVAVFSPFAGMSLLNGDFVDARETIRLLSPDQYLWVGIYFGFGLGEQLVHYYCDRCLFRFKNANVREAVAPLLMK
jgi:hypothetical protein